jgi:autotransporter-associated beta strand protein
LETPTRAPISRRRIARSRSLEPLEPPRFLSAAVWTGDAGDGEWSNAANWQGAQLPAAGQDVDFPLINGAVNIITLQSKVTIGNLSFEGGYYLQGASITLDGNISATPALPDTVSNAVLGHNVTVDVSYSNGVTLLNPSDGGHGYGITETTVDHVGFLYIGGSSATYTGPTVVASGTLEVDCPMSSDVQVDSGARLEGDGTVDGVDVQENGGLGAGINLALPDRGFSVSGPSGGISSSGASTSRRGRNSRRDFCLRTFPGRTVLSPPPISRAYR